MSKQEELVRAIIQLTASEDDSYEGGGYWGHDTFMRRDDIEIPALKLLAKFSEEERRIGREAIADYFRKNYSDHHSLTVEQILEILERKELGETTQKESKLISEYQRGREALKAKIEFRKKEWFDALRSRSDESLQEDVKCHISELDWVLKVLQEVV